MKQYAHEFITGVIGPISWNRREEINGYSIFTEDDEDILLKGKNVEKNFLKFKGRQVKVAGYFWASLSKGARIFEVTKTSLEKRVA